MLHRVTVVAFSDRSGPGLLLRTTTGRIASIEHVADNSKLNPHLLRITSGAEKIEQTSC